MISRQHRFHGHGSLNYVYRHGKSVRGPMCAIKAAPNNKRQYYRAAVVVSKKVHKNAIIRNRIRRRIYEVIRLKVKPEANYDFVVTVFNPAIAEITHEELTTMITAQLRQLALNKNSQQAPAP